MIGIVQAFAPTYARARTQFLEAAATASLPIESHCHPLLGRDGEDLAMDVVRDGPPDADKLLIVSSGCHGVEGFCGSGVQVFALHDQEWRDKAHAAGVATLYIHALNPYGFSHIRRFTHENVDLNRNFPTPGWAEEAPVYWEKRTRKDPRRWPGHTPLSEPESRFLHQQMDQFQPQLVVSIHAPYGVLDFDGPHDPPLRLGRLRMDKLGVFPGSLGHYGGLHRGVPVVTIELEHALRMPPDAEVRAMWRDLRHWMNTRLLDGADAVAGVKPPGLQR